MKTLSYFLPSGIKHWLTNPNSDEQRNAVAEATHPGDVHQDKFVENISALIQKVNLYCQKTENHKRGQLLGRHLYHDSEYRCSEVIRLPSEEQELAQETVKTNVECFDFTSMSVPDALRWLLKTFWPEEEPEIQHLLLKQFSRHYIKCTERPPVAQPAGYNLSWAIIMLNADLHGAHKGRKMTCKEFITNLNRANRKFRYHEEELKNIYNSIKAEPLYALRVPTRRQAAEPTERLTDTNPISTVHKTGNLTCKRVQDRNGRKTRKGQRAWKPFTAVLKGMVLHLQNETSDTSEADDKNAIRLHHAVAYPVDYKNRPHVLCLRTADARLFYFQAESEEEQTIWVAMINLIAGRYSAPPLTSASHSIKEPYPEVLPSFPSTLSLQQQLEHHKGHLLRLSEEIGYYLSLPVRDGFYL